MAKQQGLYLPVVYNTSSYEKVETLRLLEGYVDIYLPDLNMLTAQSAAGILMQRTILLVPVQQLQKWCGR